MSVVSGLYSYIIQLASIELTFNLEVYVKNQTPAQFLMEPDVTVESITVAGSD